MAKISKKEQFRKQVKQAQKKYKRREKIKKESERIWKNIGNTIYGDTGGGLGGSTLNFKDNPYTKKPKVKVDKRRKQTKAEEISEQILSSNMTVAQLKKYIKQATSTINSTIDELYLDDRLERSFNIIADKYGTYRNKLTTMSKGKKDDLLRYARLLKSHLNLDDYTSYGKEKVDKKVQKGFTTYIMNAGNLHKDLTISDFNNISKMFSKLSNDLVQRYGSQELIDLWTAREQSDMNISAQDFASMAIDIYNNNKGITNEELADLFREELKETFDIEFFDEDL